MYVKVHKIKDRWFRVDNGTLVGSAVPPGNILENLKHIYGSDKLFAEKDGLIILIYSGYYDKFGIFNHFCKRNDCSKCDVYTHYRFCYKRFNQHNSAGFYVKTN